MNIQNENKPHFSVSQLIDYLQCPFAYYLRHIAGIQWKKIPSAVCFGSSVHKAVEYMNSRRRDGLSVNEDDIVGMFYMAWSDAIENNNVSWKKAEEPAELLVKGQQLISLYYKQFHKHIFTEVELGFRLPILDPMTGLYVRSRDMVGYIDAIDGDNTLIEFKTTGRTPSQYQIDGDLQLGVYHWAAHLLYGVPARKILVVSLVRTKQPKIEVLETHRSQDTHTRLLSLIEKVIRAIDHGMYYPNPVGGFGCGSCNYREECQRQWPL